MSLVSFSTIAIRMKPALLMLWTAIDNLLHAFPVFSAILDHCGRYVITGSDDRLVKIWSMETAFCLASCRGHEVRKNREYTIWSFIRMYIKYNFVLSSLFGLWNNYQGDITDLSVSSNNAVVASASNDYSIRVVRFFSPETWYCPPLLVEKWVVTLHFSAVAFARWISYFCSSGTYRRCDCHCIQSTTLLCLSALIVSLVLHLISLFILYFSKARCDESLNNWSLFSFSILVN